MLTLFFHQINKDECRNMPWKTAKGKPPAFVCLEMESKTLPNAMKSAWKQLAHQDISNIAEIVCRGAILNTDYSDRKRNLQNMYYNAHMGLVPLKIRLRSLNNFYRQYLMKSLKDKSSFQWLMSNYNHDLVNRFLQGSTEAFDELFISDITLRMVSESGGCLNPHLSTSVIPEYVRTLKEIKREMTGYEGQVEMAAKIYEGFFNEEVPELSDIFLREYFYGVALETPDLAIKGALEFLLDDCCAKDLRKLITSQSLPNGSDISEYMPIAAWDINARYFLTDYSGYCFFSERLAEIEQCMKDLVGGNDSAFKKLFETHKNDLRPFAEFLEIFTNAGRSEEASVISKHLRVRGIY
jgi:hypothetical protein